jgi:chemotaxis signal transduction protein
VEQYIGFTLDETEFTVPIVKVREIIQMPAVTRVPQTPHYLEGVTNLRGAVIPVVNLKRLLNGNGSGGGAARVIVVASGGMKFGIMVDMITGTVLKTTSPKSSRHSLFST